MFLELSQMIGNYLDNNNISSIIDEIMQNGSSIGKIFILLGSLIATITGFASSIISMIVVLALTPVFMYYLMKEKTLIFTSISKVAPKSIRHHVVELGRRSDSVIRKYFKGQGIMMTIIFIYFSITLGILSFFIDGFSLYHVVIFALLMGLFNLIPYVGAWLGLFAPMIFLFTLHLENQSLPGYDNIYLIAMLIVLIIHLVEQALEMSVIQPNVIGKQVHIHPLAVLSSLIFFGGVFGFVGVLLAVPLAGTIRAFIEYFGELDEQRKKQESQIAKIEAVQPKGSSKGKKKSTMI